MIIGLTGPQRAGKTTAWNRAGEKHGAHRLSIAEQIKEVSHFLLETKFSDAEKDVQFEQLKWATPRHVYIYVGNMDEFDNGLWVRRMFRSGYQGPEALHIVESVGKMFQWYHIMKFALQNNDQCAILDIQRPDHEYKDSRTAIMDFLPMMRIENNGLIDRFHKDVDEVIHTMQRMSFPRTEEDIETWKTLNASRISQHPEKYL